MRLNIKLALSAAIIAVMAINKAVYAEPSNEGDLSNITFDTIVLKELTPEFIAKVKAKKAKELAYLDKLERAYELPHNLLKIKWLIESKAGDLNVKNKSGYEGHFQFGEYEQQLCKLDNPYSLRQAARSTVCLLRDYHIKFQAYAESPVDWSTRNITDFYMMHQQGFRGAAEQYNALAHDKPLSRRIKLNMCSNIPKQYHSALFKPNSCKLNQGITDKQFAIFFYKMWEAEMNRINIELMR